ncbi:Complex I-B12 [Aphelenchoides besseyi]|nr:Complex I-B12 [Aphelenchoides besseyi]
MIATFEAKTIRRGQNQRVSLIVGWWTMGHGHHEPFEVPHYSVYNKWQISEPLVEHQKRLNRLGLKDPWIRNVFFAYNPKYPRPNRFLHMWRVCRSGLVPGLSIAAFVIALEEGYSYYKHGHTSWGGGH